MNEILSYVVSKVWLVSAQVKAEFAAKIQANSLQLTQTELNSRREQHLQATHPRFHNIVAQNKKRKMEYRGKDVEILDSWELEYADRNSEGGVFVSSEILGEIRLRGVLQKEGDMCVKGTEESMNELLYMGQHPNVKGVLLNIDSGGGEVSGVEEFAKAIASFRQTYQKPIFAYISDSACSAAYWLASQCDKIYLSGENAQVGSIGTMISLIDDEAFLEMNGIKVIDIRATESFNKNEAYYQALSGNDTLIRKEFLDIINRNFQKSVTAKRTLTDRGQENGVQIQLTGKVFFGTDAIRAGLADGITASLIDAYVELNREAKRMAREANKPEAAPQKVEIESPYSSEKTKQLFSINSIHSKIKTNLDMSFVQKFKAFFANVFGGSVEDVKLSLKDTDLTPEQEAKLSAALENDFSAELMRTTANEATTELRAELESLKTKMAILDTLQSESIKNSSELQKTKESLATAQTQITELAKGQNLTKGVGTQLGGNSSGDQNPQADAQKAANQAQMIDNLKKSNNTFVNMYLKQFDEGAITEAELNTKLAKLAKSMGISEQ